MILTYKTRLEPNNKQAEKFKQFAGAARYAYNWAIAKEKEAYKLSNGFIKDVELTRLFTKHKVDNTWLYGAIKHDLKLRDRTFKCNSCGLVIDRDYNASLNLYQYGIHTARSAEINVCGVSHQTEVALAKQDTMKQKLNIKSIR